MNKYDVIVIGAGNGGLAAACSLARAGKKVAVFESHNIPGGCGTSFRRGRFEFEVALHQLSSMGTPEKPGELRQLFKKYDIENKIDWIEIKELFRVNFHDGTGVSLPVGKDKCLKHLQQVFPKEADNLRRYFDTVWKFCEEANAFAAKSAQSTGEPSALKKAVMKSMFPKLYPTLAKYGLCATQQVMDEFFTDKKLQLALSAYWCFMGMPPARFPWSILAKCMYIYTEDKPFYLRGTSQMMNQAIAESIRECGGDLFFNTAVKRIITKDGVAVGVEDQFGNIYNASRIVSNISPIDTYTKLMDTPESANEYLKPYTVGISALTCFIGLDCTPEEIGFTTSFTLNYDSLDANEDFKDAYKLLPHHDPIVATCYTVDDPTVSPKGTSVITAGTLKYSNEWEKLTPEQYYQKKYEAANVIIDRLEKQYPGFRSHIEEMEIATPLTHMRYLHHPGGAIYGYEQDLKSSVFFYPNESKVKNLEFAGGWVNVCGFGPNYLFADKLAQKMLKEMK